MTLILPTFCKENTLRFERSMRAVNREFNATMDDVDTFLIENQAAMQTRHYRRP